jgi:hypothetical protein
VVRFRRLVFALVYLFSGVLLGLLLLEGILRCNPTLLQRGMALPAPVDPPLTVQTYDVHYSDADAFYWRPDLIRPVPASDDRLEARVSYETDEYGFRNPAPVSPRLDAVVLGRSISLAGHLAEPWPALLARRLDWQVFNLSQPGSGIQVKELLLERFGLPRRPHWIIVEVVPSIDILGDHSIPASVGRELFVPVVQQLVRRQMAAAPIHAGQAIYPLSIDLPKREVELTCCLHYLDFFSLDQGTLERSLDWANYRRELLDIVGAARASGACVALLNVPTKPDVYFPLVLYPEQLEPSLREYIPLKPNSGGWIEQDPGGEMSVDSVRQNALVGRDLVESFARENDLVWIDPNDAIIQSVLDGQDPFMVYDSHWNQLGHEIVAETVIESLQQATCP